MSRRVLLAALVALAALPVAPAAAQAPFGHPCVPESGVRHCPTADLEQRVPSFDGTPLDVDVTLPAQGTGPFPLLLLLHGLGGTKTDFLAPTATNPGYDARTFARAGYAVVTPTARGFGNSCGRPESRTAGCEDGWTRLADMRYEVRDLQTLAGLLVDEGIARPDRIAATGVSYGGGMATMLAFLKDRIRTPDGLYAPWTSPRGTPLSLRAAWPRWLWSNGESIFLRSGRADAWSRFPTGVPTTAYANGIFAVAFGGFVAPLGSPLHADLRRWKEQLDDGSLEPSVRPTLDIAYSLHGAAGVRRPVGGPAPLLLQSGWTDALFPVGQSLAIRARFPGNVRLQLGDIGHAPAANRPGDVALFNEQGREFLKDQLVGGGPRLRRPPVTALPMRCSGQGGGPAFPGVNVRRTLRFGTERRLRIDARGASSRLAAAVNPLGPTGSHCTRHRADLRNRAQFSVRSRGVTLLGQPVITGRVTASGRLGQIAARVWDRDRRTDRQRLITRGVFRLKDDERGRFRFTLDGNAWHFARGHRIVVELLGRDAPTYAASPASFRASLTDVRVTLPVRRRR